MSSTSSTTIVARYAKSGKSSCEKCSEKIDSKSLRLGLKSRDAEGCDSIKWHHFNCFSSLDSVSVSSVETIKGFSKLTDSDQDKLKKIVCEGDQSSAKTDEDEEAGQKKKVIEEKVVSKYAKSQKSSCNKCFEKIESKSLKLGLRSWDPQGIEITKWHHFDCFFTLDKDPITLESIKGFLKLKSDDQEKLKKLLTERGQSSKKRQRDEETEPDERDLKKLKTDEDVEARHEKKVTNEKIIAEYAKSGHSSCKKCSEKIESKSLRLGLSRWDPRGFENKRWHHLNCFFTLDKDPISPESVEGFSDLKPNDQEKLKKLLTEGGKSSKKREGDEETDPNTRDLKKQKTNEDNEARQEKKVTKEKIVAEYAKTGKSLCKKCLEKIDFKSLRLGLSSGFEHKKWHHTDCFFTLDKDPITQESIEGLLELKSSDQEMLKKLVTEGFQSSNKREGDEEIVPHTRDLKKLKTDEDNETKKEKKVTKEKFFAEYAKSGKSSCKKCLEKIDSKSLRLGFINLARQGFEYTKWHHIDCFFTLDKDPILPESFEGFLELKSDDQEKLKKLLTEGFQSSKKIEGDEETKPDIRDLKKLESNDQEKLKKLVTEGDQLSKKRERDEEIELEKRGLKKLKTDEDVEARHEKKLTKEKIIAEYAKSGHSSCKKCSEKIESKSLRLGLSRWDPRGFENKRWHHVNCFFTLDKDPISPESVEGFLDLKGSDQEKLKKLVTEGG